MSGIIVSIIVFIGSLALIFSEKINRTIVGIAGVALMVGLGKLFGFFTEEQAIASVDSTQSGCCSA